MSKQMGDEVSSEVSQTFDLLSDAYRRGVLYTVERDGQTTVEELSRRIAEWQSEGGRGADPSAVKTSLVHSHLPKLAEAGFVDYDRERGIVESTGSKPDLEPLLRNTREREPTLFQATRTSSPERLKGLSR